MSSDEVTRRLEHLNRRWLDLARTGEFERAWQVSDAAQTLRAGVDCSSWPRHQQFIWRGEDFRGKRLLLRCYHGLGDTIQFARFVPRACRLASEVTLWVQPQLIPLLETMSDSGARLLPLHDGAP